MICKYILKRTVVNVWMKFSEFSVVINKRKIKANSNLSESPQNENLFEKESKVDEQELQNNEQEEQELQDKEQIDDNKK